MTEVSIQTLQVSCIQMHWAKPIEFNLQKTLHYIKEAAVDGSRVVLFPEANLTSYYFPYLVTLSSKAIDSALNEVRDAAFQNDIWVIVGTIQGKPTQMLNIAHVIDPDGNIVHAYAKIHMAGRDEKQYCRGGDKLSLFSIDGVWCTLVICRDGRHPELYRIPAMAGAQILFQ
ncbi:MAG: carbon-nitrogen hydrolase family protein, partial [Anaerolineales bacterium]|nr:carbon-nitrogen hydrolase family protein [Anaerolineales bacterium]